jgi:hypothetical protein
LTAAAWAASKSFWQYRMAIRLVFRLSRNLPSGLGQTADTGSEVSTTYGLAFGKKEVPDPVTSNSSRCCSVAMVMAGAVSTEPKSATSTSALLCVTSWL